MRKCMIEEREVFLKSSKKGQFYPCTDKDYVIKKQF